MNTRSILLLILFPLLLTSCEETPKQKETSSEATSEAPSLKETPPPVEPPAALDTLAELQSLTPEGFDILGHRYGDLNKDELTTDLILILKAKNEEETSDIDLPTPRPLHLYTRQADGSLQLRAQNDQTVLCVNCGGIFGDPYSGIAIKNGYFSVEHYGGSNWRWTKIITYRYHRDSDSWRLHQVGEESYHTSVPDKVETTIQRAEDFGIVDLKDYRIYGSEE